MKLLSTSEVARALGISVDAAQRLLQAGKLPGRKVDGKWRTPSRAVAERVKFKARYSLKRVRGVRSTPRAA